MSSKDRTEIESVKKELFRAGIPAEIRSNPLAEALRVTRLELWVQNERDFFNASKVYAGLQARGNGKSKPSPAPAPGENPAGFIEVADPDEDTSALPLRAVSRGGQKTVTESPSGELEEASSLLEQEIEQMLEREGELASTCASLRGQVNGLSEKLERAEAELDRAVETRLATEKEQAAEVAGLQTALERERAQRVRAEELLERERREIAQQMKAREEALFEVQKKLEAKIQLCQSQQATVVELRKEIVAREQQWEEHEKIAAKAHAEAVAEREARMAAEERAERAAAAKRTLEKQLAEQKDLQRQMSDSVASLNALRSKLRAKRASTIDPATS